MAKYELTDELILKWGIKLHRIRALKDFGDVKKGDLGGYVESESNLSHGDNCWVYDNAIVLGRARVRNNARVYGNAILYMKAIACENAEVYGNARVFDTVILYDNAKVYGNAQVYDNARVYDVARVYGNAQVYGNALLQDNVRVYGKARVYGEARICGNSEISNTFDYIVFKNSWSSGRFFTYTKPNKMWSVGCFYGTGDELITKAYKDNKLSGDYYKEYVDFVKRLENLCERN